ncbi:hypothetical protein [Prosthecobacter sp.]|uniref:hypothetical protein n=1 Tax=Prosthecobacter sp. TaxID=1965333 RepID=UPI003782E5B5
MSEQTPDVEPEVKTSQPPGPVVRRKRRLTKTLCTDRIPWLKQGDVITAIPIAYEKQSGPITYKDVGDIVGLSEATLLQLSASFYDLGLVQKVDGGKFIPAAELQEYGRIRGFSPEKAWLKLGPLFERSWFGQELLPRLKLREMNEMDAIHCLAEVSGADKDHQAQLEMGILYLERAGLILRDSGNIKLSANYLGGAKESPDPQTPPPPAAPKDPIEIEIEGLEKHSLTLDPKAGRKVVIFAPPTLRTAELARLQQWLGFQFIIEEDTPK